MTLQLWLALPTVTCCGVVVADDTAGELQRVTVTAQIDRGASLGTPVPDVGSPQSVIGQEAIQTWVSPVGDYGTVLNLSPSYVSSAPNGPGFDAAKNQSIRGFADGQFNVTMDGIPFGDPDNFQHHTTSYFPASMLDQVAVDRSPGGAGDLGYASFGGSVNLLSEAIPEDARARAFLSYGSFATSLVGATVNTGAPASPGESGFLATAQYEQSDGALSHSPGYKGDVLLKSLTLIGPLRLTALYSYDHYRFYNAGSITTTDLALYGPSYGYNTDPSSPNYYGYANTERSADFGYLALESDREAPWSFTEKLYTYSYRNSGLSLKGDQTSSPIGSGFDGINPDDIAGRLTNESYRTVGNDLRLIHTDSFGRGLLGLWIEHSWQTESRLGLDLSTGDPYDVNQVSQSPIYYDLDSHLDTIQPYGEYRWQVTPEWALRAGLRYQVVTRDFDAAVTPNFLPGTAGTVSRTVRSTLPSFDTTYRVGEGTNVYAQVSKGALVPSQSFFYTASPERSNQVIPETSLATQLGLVSEGARYALGLDAYHIAFDNYVSTIVQEGNTLYVNSARVRYEGVEFEGHLVLGAGFTAVANASLIRATFEDSGMTSPSQQAGDTIPFAPRYTGLAGILYGHGPWEASLLTKFIGTQYQGKDGSADGSKYRVGSYSYTNATMSRRLMDLPVGASMRLELAVNNLWDSQAITDNAGPSILGPNLVNVLPRRNVMLSVGATWGGSEGR